jgi:hypothetical protein
MLAMRWNSDEQEWSVVGPKPHSDFVKMVVGYALTCKMRLPAVSNTIEEARYQARRHGRSNVLAIDIRTALLDYQIPSDEALQQAFEPTEKRREVVVRTHCGSQGEMNPVITSAANATATNAIHISVKRISLRRSQMSPSAPAGNANKKKGNADAVWVSATYIGPAWSETINQAAPTLCMNVPMSEKMSAISKSRNVCPRSGRHTLVVALARSSLSDG